MGSTLGGFGVDAEDVCGCMYDDMSTSGLTFEEFNEAWTAADVDPSDPATQALESAALGCGLASADAG